jgi:hypothetical protein
MKMDYEYIEMAEVEKKTKTSVYAIFSKSDKEHIGTIKWYAPWRQYCFFPVDDTIWNRGCLTDVIGFINQLMEMRKK